MLAKPIKNITKRSRPRSFGHPVVGWREWICLPDLGIPYIKAKIDTGAATSSLHAYDIRQYIRAGKKWVKFKVHPIQRNHAYVILCRAPVVDIRRVKSSTGLATIRPVIATTFSLGHYVWQAEITLIDRSEMGFRMLLGRQAISKRFLVHVGKSFILSKKPSEI